MTGLSTAPETAPEAVPAQPMQAATLKYGQEYVAKCDTKIGEHRMQAGDTFRVSEIEGITGSGWTFLAEITHADGTTERADMVYLPTVLNPEVFAVEEPDNDIAAATASKAAAIEA